MWSTPRVFESAGQPHEKPEASLTSEPFTTAEQVVLCCFGLDQSTELTSSQLREDLVKAGFPAAAARQILRSCPLVHRSSTGLFGLRRLSAEGSVP
jgi:hypothetical protein